MTDAPHLPPPPEILSSLDFLAGAACGAIAVVCFSIAAAIVVLAFLGNRNR